MSVHSSPPSFLRKQESISFRKAETFAAGGNGAACAAVLDSCLRRNDMVLWEWFLRLAVCGDFSVCGKRRRGYEKKRRGN
ncbi:MAG: hypothetical protein ACR2P5_00260 [Gammaproteobacteria bacterium]